MHRPDGLPAVLRRVPARPIAVAVSALLLLLAAPAFLPSSAAAAGSRLTGRVLDSDSNRPIAGAEVELANTSGGQGYFRARTNARGEFALDRIPADRWYTLTVGAKDYAEFVLSGWQFPATQRSVDLVVPLDRAGVLDVKLARSDGRTPIPGARVAIQRETNNEWWEGYRPPPAPVFTDASGTARFVGLRAGSYTVTADVAGLSPAEARRVTVRRGETATVPLKLTRPASLSGTVRLADGRGVEGIVVTARGPGEAVGTTDADGAFSIGDLAPGRWRIEVTHDGFEPAASRETYLLAEGGARDGIALTVTPKAPELAFVLQREAFLPDASVRIGLRSFRVGELEMIVYRIPDATLLDPTRDFRRFGSAPDTTGLSRVLTWKHVIGAGPEWSWREGEAVIPENLAPGAYVLRGHAGDLSRGVIFFVTDLGLIVKRSLTQLLVSTASLGNGRPVAGARVFAIVNPAPEGEPGQGWSRAVVEKGGVPSVATDEQGLVTVPTPNGVPIGYTGGVSGTPRLRLVVLSEEHGIAVSDAPIAPAAERGGDQLFLYTDRPIYRPGHTVHWKAFVRKAAGDGYALPEAATAQISFRGPDGTALEAPAAPLSARGSADGSLELPKELALGDWTVSATAGTASGSATFAVQEYRKPEFRVEVTPDRDVYVNGDEVRFRIAAAYFFGSPVFGATVRYNLFESRLAGDDESAGDEEEGPHTGYGRVLKTGETRTDLDGKAEVMFTPEHVSYDRRLTLEVEVVDASSRMVSDRGSAVMGRGLFTLSVRPAAFVLPAGGAVPVEVVTRDHTGKPVSAAVTVTLDQEAWNPIERRYTRSTRPLASATVTTARDGRARLTLTPSPARAGQILINGRAEDAKGNRITAQSSVWVWDERVTDYPYRYPTLEALADRERYAPGDTVRVLINTDARNAQVLATLEGRDLYDRRVITLTGGTGVVSFALRPGYAPNAFVSVHVRKGREVQSRTLEIPIAADRRTLDIALKPDRERYAPGDTARIDVETRDGAGRPVPAEVTVAVVDEAIFSLRPDNTPDPHDVFYGRRPNWVTTTVAFPSLLLGGADKGGRDEPRRNFRDVALWAPAVLTDESGRASVGLRYPDNLTTWRITSRGLTANTLVGKAVAKTLVTKDLVARLAGPRFLVAGDEADLVSVVNSRIDQPIVGADATLQVSGPASLAGPSSAKFNVPPRGEARAEWKVRVPAEAPREAADALFTFRAQSPTGSDALEVGVPVRPRAVALTLHGAGLLDAATRTVTAALPANLERTGSEVALEFSPSPAGMALGAVDYLDSYPYGCNEQTANAVLPALAMLDALRATGMKLADSEERAARLALHLRRLAANQNDDGGWGWWKGGDSDPFLTALVLDAIARAGRLDLAPSEARDALRRGMSRLPRTLAETRSLDGEAYLLAHLVAVAAAADNGETQGDGSQGPTLRMRLADLAANLVAQRTGLGNGGVALAALGLEGLGKKAEAREFVTLLLSRAQRDGLGLHWTSDPAEESSWFGEELETTAYALSAISRVTPAETRAAEVVRWLAARRTGFSWRSTRTTGPVAIALADYLVARPGEARPDYHLRVEWNGETVLDRRIVPADAAGGSPQRVRLTGARLKPGDNRLTLTRQGAGSVYYAWEANALVPSPGPDVTKEKRLTVTREYLRAERTQDYRGRPRILANPIAPGEALRVGESVLVRLTLTAPQALDYVMIEDPRVSGFEVDALLPDGADWPYGAHAEERDDRAAFFLERLDAGETVIEYLVRPEMAGAFMALPTSAGAMYDPDLRTRAGEARLVVEAK